MTDSDTLILVAAGLAATAALLAAWLAWRAGNAANSGRQSAERLEVLLRDEAATTRRDNADLSTRQRQELGTAVAQSSQQLNASLTQFSQTLNASLTQFGQSITGQSDLLGRQLSAQLEAFARQLQTVGQQFDERQQAAQADARAAREEQGLSLARFGETQTQQLGALAEGNAQRMNELRGSVESRLAAIQADNTAKLDEMRRTVDEKLNDTLQKRLGESFSRVAERLEQVQRGLGEMQSLAAGVDGLKKVLTGVKTRGMWGEVQLAGLLEQVLVAEQYEANRATRPGSNERVEFAIRLPGRDAEDSSVWLPIDAKFPREDYERLLDAQERGDVAAVEEAGKQLEGAIKREARNIRDKYVEPPHTTDFALMFLPTEGLYAEVIRRPALSELLQREFRVTVAGPTTLTALLNSLQMGFRTLAIQKRSSEVWKVLGTVKSEFEKFGDVLAKAKKQLETVQNTIGSAETRTRAITRNLRTVESLPSATAGKIPAMSDFDAPDAAVETGGGDGRVFNDLDDADDRDPERSLEP